MYRHLFATAVAKRAFRKLKHLVKHFYDLPLLYYTVTSMLVAAFFCCQWTHHPKPQVHICLAVQRELLQPD
eukprot:781973-Amphidinium_carterae.2